MLFQHQFWVVSSVINKLHSDLLRTEIAEIFRGSYSNSSSSVVPPRGSRSKVHAFQEWGTSCCWAQIRQRMWKSETLSCANSRKLLDLRTRLQVHVYVVKQTSIEPYIMIKSWVTPALWSAKVPNSVQINTGFIFTHKKILDESLEVERSCVLYILHEDVELYTEVFIGYSNRVTISYIWLI